MTVALDIEKRNDFPEIFRKPNSFFCQVRYKEFLFLVVCTWPKFYLKIFCSFLPLIFGVIVVCVCVCVCVYIYIYIL